MRLYVEIENPHAIAERKVRAMKGSMTRPELHNPIQEANAAHREQGLALGNGNNGAMVKEAFFQ